MSFAQRIMQAYFDFVYNRVYDFTTGRLHRYRKLQGRCVSRLELEDGDNILCVGVGTGNEVLHILQIDRNVKIVGVDYSKTALQKAYRKALARGKEIEVLIMDARRLEFAAESFDKVLCLHVMDFIDDNKEATTEILRVLKHGGQFVITYPSDKEGLKLGCNLLRDVIRTNLDSGKHPVKAFFELIAQMLMGFVYLPLVFRLKKKFYLRRELEAMITGLTTGHFRIEEDSIYQDFIVYGRKSIKGGESDAS